MKLSQVIAHLPLVIEAGPADAEVVELTDASRLAGPGVLFVARPAGGERWRGFAADAASRGVAAVVASEKIDVPDGVSLVVGPVVDQRLAGELAAAFFGRPADRLKLIGVTGTNGKTTVATLSRHLLHASDIKCGFIGTTAIDVGDPSGAKPAELTTPGAIELQRLLSAMVSNGCAACAMEVSSHALDQGRVEGLRFDVGVFTNLTQDHLDYHGTMEAYGRAKAKLFASLPRGAVAVLNADDPASAVMAEATEADVVWTTVIPPGPDEAGDEPTLRIAPGRHQAKLELLSARVLEATASGCRVKLCHGLSEDEVAIPLVGVHNVSNWLQATAAAVAAGANWKDSAATFDRLAAAPGRLEAVRVDGLDVQPAVLVDYAHTPDALVNVLRALRPVTAGRLICVFGCGGDRDRTKRPIMAGAASEMADVAVLTSDNPRTEDPQRILDDAAAGVPPEKRESLMVEMDRATAIRRAVAMAEVGDTVLIAGKGHEDYQIVADPTASGGGGGTKKIHFDDREQAAEALTAWAGQRAAAKGNA